MKLEIWGCRVWVRRLTSHLLQQRRRRRRLWANRRLDPSYGFTSYNINTCSSVENSKVPFVVCNRGGMSSSPKSHSTEENLLESYQIKISSTRRDIRCVNTPKLLQLLKYLPQNMQLMNDSSKHTGFYLKCVRWFSFLKVVGISKFPQLMMSILSKYEKRWLNGRSLNFWGYFLSNWLRLAPQMWRSGFFFLSYIIRNVWIFQFVKT